MQVPINDPKRQYVQIASQVDDAVARVLKSGWYLMGAETEQFESDFAAVCGTTECVAVANGTDALELALRALDVGDGDEVMTVANAGGYSTSAIFSVRSSPVYVDIDETLTMDLSGVVAGLSDSTAAIVATHLYGFMVDVVDLRSRLDQAGRPDVKIVEDCAQAHGARIGEKAAGSVGDIGCFSFYPTKNLGALGDAGAIVTSDANLADRVRRLHQYGWRSRYRSELPHGRNSRMDEIQAAILNESLPHLGRWNERRRGIVNKYGEAASDAMHFVHAGIGDSRFVGHLAIGRSPSRSRVAESLTDAGIGTSIHYPVLDTDAEWMSDAPHRIAALDASMTARDEILTVPCFPSMTDDEVEYVCDQLSKVQI